VVSSPPIGMVFDPQNALLSLQAGCATVTNEKIATHHFLAFPQKILTFTKYNYIKSS